MRQKTVITLKILMKKSNSLFLTASFCIPFVLLTACSGTGFKGNDGVGTKSNSNSEGEKVDLFDSKKGSNASDIVWIIDNSGSMSEEAAHVRANFEKFINDTAAQSDIKIALISVRGGIGTAVSMPNPSALRIVANQLNLNI